ncbi:MAG: type II toxin-antitoxin system VapC family toxin [Abitibacteriaceae bacterium]|nr:type II toxin-antitoxin system VapC family toxin [Abditibacteriaceae bacterium]MBV9867160.1 type II toxin-antitoxin system VapC family toxin [Abditibacteriaceae bacterium]
MDKIVVDSSVVIKWFVVEPHSTQAHTILSAYQSHSVTLLAPDLLYAEMGNIIWKKNLCQGLDGTDAQVIIDTFNALSLVITPTADLLQDAYRLAITYQRTVFDSLYLALSQREQCNFVTADEKLVNALGSNFPGAVWIGNWK